MVPIVCVTRAFRWFLNPQGAQATVKTSKSYISEAPPALSQFIPTRRRAFFVRCQLRARACARARAFVYSRTNAQTRQGCFFNALRSMLYVVNIY